MATNGFEFAYMLDGSNARPVVRDFVLGAAAEHLIGDLMVVQADGFIDAATGSTTLVTCVMQEYVAAADITAGTTTAKAAIITTNQVWRCSSDASTAATVFVGIPKLIDTVDKNTIDADDVTNGAMVCVNKDEVDSDGNLIFYVMFTNCSFGSVA
jgi:hypothetical protein